MLTACQIANERRVRAESATPFPETPRGRWGLKIYPNGGEPFVGVTRFASYGEAVETGEYLTTQGILCLVVSV